MRLSRAILFLCFILMSAPAPAEEAAPAAPPENPGAITSSNEGRVMNLKVDPALQKLEAPYKAATKNFSKEQLDALKQQEETYMKTTNADIALVSTELQLKFCTENNADIKKNGGKYQSEFGVLRDQVQAAQRAHQARLRAAREAAVPFIDQKILDDHYTYMAKLVVGLSQGMLEATYRNGAFAKTDCQEVAQKLDAASSRAKTQADMDEATIAEKVSEMKQAAEGGDMDAMTNLGLLQLSGGTGIPKDTKAGMALLTKAAEKDYARAEYMLGLAYSSSTFGTGPDKEKAKYWLGKAAAKGNKKAAAVMQALDKPRPQPPGK